MSVRRVPKRQAGRDSGQGLVEFALVFPVIILILFGVFDFGRAIYTYNTLGNAARQGARVAAVNQLAPPATNNQCAEDMPIEDQLNPHWSIRACTASSAISLGVQTSDVTVSYASPPDDPTLLCTSPVHVGCIATVTVTYTWRAMTPVIGNLIGPITFSSTSRIPIERVFP